MTGLVFNQCLLSSHRRREASLACTAATLVKLQLSSSCALGYTTLVEAGYRYHWVSPYNPVQCCADCMLKAGLGSCTCPRSSFIASTPIVHSGTFNGHIHLLSAIAQLPLRRPGMAGTLSAPTGCCCPACAFDCSSIGETGGHPAAWPVGFSPLCEVSASPALSCRSVAGPSVRAVSGHEHVKGCQRSNISCGAPTTPRKLKRLAGASQELCQEFEACAIGGRSTWQVLAMPTEIVCNQLNPHL